MNATQIVLGVSRRRSWQYVFGPGVSATVARESGPDLDVHIVTHDEAAKGRRLPVTGGARLGRSRTISCWLVGLAGPALLTLLLSTAAPDAGLANDVLLCLALTVAAALLGGLRPALASAAIGSLLLNWFFTPPIHRLTIADPRNMVALLGVAEDSVDLDIPETLPTVAVDRGLLERAVANIVENAVTYSPPSQPVLVSASALADRVELRVVDRGPGVPDEAKDRILGAFQRYGDAPRGEGVGLGLAVARGFVEAMGGTLAAEDTPGGGLTMTVTPRMTDGARARPGGGQGRPVGDAHTQVVSPGVE